MVNEKVLRSLKAAVDYLERAITAFNQKDETPFADSLWHVAAELEYALFLFSITFQNENVSQYKIKLNPEKTEIKPVLEEAQNLLREAEKFAADGKLLESYKNAYVARHYIRKVQEDLTKKKRK